jgi:hypothetical protein
MDSMTYVHLCWPAGSKLQQLRPMPALGQHSRSPPHPQHQMAMQQLQQMPTAAVLRQQGPSQQSRAAVRQLKQGRKVAGQQAAGQVLHMVHSRHARLFVLSAYVMH